ncbi:NERD domain-containing protein [Halobacillus naozhouensis]|uniref:NERD domain-containing protein n=1 Tax=Halobacillus naozhouensis TaxID=554880 RepID=A0ABY8IY26_9BACI|nr:NERD domain-containing protein [Halobacillus naozhouensis]WFT73536.1 NERD domain-containing protein [Halobacillus naozhouensis]
MAQLIKLYDYISRYETNMYQYSSQYIRLKQDNWKKMKHLWEQGELCPNEEGGKFILEKDDKGKSWHRFLKKKQVESGDQQGEVQWSPKTMIELKQYFLNGIFPFQVKWASTTIQKKSFIDRTIHKDQMLKMLLQRLPDTFLVMYYPVVEIKSVPVKAEILLIGPQEVEIISVMDFPDVTMIHPSSESSWHVEKKEKRSKVLSPMHGLKRTETFVRSVLHTYAIDYSFHKVVLAPSHTFDGAKPPFLTSYIDETRFSDWLNKKREYSAPLKHNQLKMADLLMRHTKKIAFKRPEWEVDQTSKE